MHLQIQLEKLFLQISDLHRKILALHWYVCSFNTLIKSLLPISGFVLYERFQYSTIFYIHVNQKWLLMFFISWKFLHFPPMNTLVYVVKDFINWSNSALREGMNHVKSVNILNELKRPLICPTLYLESWQWQSYVSIGWKSSYSVKGVNLYQSKQLMSPLKGQLQISIYPVHIIVEVLTTTTVHNGTV